MTLIDLFEYSRQARHGLHGDEVLWVFSVIHTSQHGTEDGGGELRHLEGGREGGRERVKRGRYQMKIQYKYFILTYLTSTYVCHVAKASDTVHPNDIV